MKRTTFFHKNIGLFFFVLAAAIAAAAVAALQQFAQDTSEKTTLAILFEILVLACFFAPCIVLGIRWLRELGFKRKTFIITTVFVTGIGVVGFFLLQMFFGAEHDIKVYDFSVYWIHMLEGRELLETSIIDYLLDLRNSFADTYNNLAAFALIPVSYLTGIKFGGYGLAIFFVYFLPACALLSIFVLRVFSLLGKKQPGALAYCVVFSIFTISTGMLWPLLNGYLDVVGVLIIAVILNISLRWDITKPDWKRALFLAVLCVLLILMRRWYAYFIVGFFISVIIAAIFDAVAKKQFKAAKIGAGILNFAIIGAVSGLLIFVANPGLFELFLGDYAGAYASYKTMSLWENIWQLLRNAKIVLVLLCACGIVLCAIKKPLRVTGLRLLLTAIITMALFHRVQDMAFHHHYLVLPILLIFACLACLFIMYQLRKAVAIPVILILAICVFNTSAAFVPAAGKLAADTPFRATLTSYPKQMENYDSMREIAKELYDRFDNTSTRIYIVGSGDLLSAELLRRSYLPDIINATPYNVESSIEDARDGFPSQLFMAEYVLLSDPVSVSHGHPEVCYQVFDMLMTDANMKDYYQVEKRYELAGGDIILLKKTKAINKECVDNLKERLESYYPDNPFVYQPDYFVALCTSDTGFWYNMWERKIHFYKWYGAPMNAQWIDLSEFTTMSFDLRSSVEGLELVVEDQNGVIYSKALTQWVTESHTVSLANSDMIHIQIREIDPDDQFDAELVFSDMTLE